MQQFHLDASKRLPPPTSHAPIAITSSSVASVTHYLPSMLLRLASAEDKLLNSSVRSHRNTVLVFLDISGYTKLAESLGKEGVAGTELLSNSLSKFFEIAIQIINSHGGDVINFCGDALMVVFPSEAEAISLDDDTVDEITSNDDHSILRARSPSPVEAARIKSDAVIRTRQAMQCALGVMGKLSPYKISDSVTLDLKIMVGYGTILSHVVATSSRVEFLITGEPLNQITVGEHLASAGKIIISKEALEVCKDNFNVSDLNSSAFVKLESLVGAPAALRPEQPLDLQPRHLQACARALDQKTVEELLTLNSKWTRDKQLNVCLDHGHSKNATCTTVFLSPQSKLIDSLDPKVVHIALQQIYEIIHTQCEKFGGFFRQFVQDDKGLVAILAFEGKEKSHENAALVSLVIRDELNKVDVDVGIGCATGKVFCGPVGCNARSEYCFVGDTVNLAARLMSISDKNQILVDLATFNKATSGVKMKPRATIKVKGKDDYIQTFSVEMSKATKNQRVAATASKATTDLHNPSDFFLYVAPFIPLTQLDCILSTPHDQPLSLIDKCGCILVMNFDNHKEYAAAIQFPSPFGGVRLILQANGGDVISHAQTSPTNYVVTALFSSKPGLSLVCSRETSARSRDVLIADAKRCIMELTQVKRFGIALGPVTSAAAGRLWITQGPAVVEAHEAARKAFSEDTAVVAAASCEDESLSLTSFPLDREVAAADAAFSQKIYIIVRQKRSQEFEKINNVISGSIFFTPRSIFKPKYP